MRRQADAHHAGDLGGASGAQRSADDRHRGERREQPAAPGAADGQGHVAGPRLGGGRGRRRAETRHADHGQPGARAAAQHRAFEGLPVAAAHRDDAVVHGDAWREHEVGVADHAGHRPAVRLHLDDRRPGGVGRGGELGGERRQKIGHVAYASKAAAGRAPAVRLGVAASVSTCGWPIRAHGIVAVLATPRMTDGYELVVVTEQRTGF